MIDKIVVVDIETSGLDPRAHGIIEIGAVKLASGEEFFRAVRLPGDAKFDASVTAINGYDEATARGADRMSMEDGMRDFSAWVGGDFRFLAGSNPKFDESFLMVEMRNRYPFRRHLIDLQTAAITYLVRASIPVPLSLSADAIYPTLLMAPEPRPHGALRGAQWEAEAFRRILQGKYDAAYKATAVSHGGPKRTEEVRP